MQHNANLFGQRFWFIYLFIYLVITNVLKPAHLNLNINSVQHFQFFYDDICCLIDSSINQILAHTNAERHPTLSSSSEKLSLNHQQVVQRYTLWLLLPRKNK